LVLVVVTYLCRLESACTVGLKEGPDLPDCRFSLSVASRAPVFNPRRQAPRCGFGRFSFGPARNANTSREFASGCDYSKTLHRPEHLARHPIGKVARAKVHLTVPDGSFGAGPIPRKKLQIRPQWSAVEPQR